MKCIDNRFCCRAQIDDGRLPRCNKSSVPFCAVIIGNLHSLQYWEYKKGEFVPSFESAEPYANEISRVVVSGAQDKAAVFLAIGSQIKGVTKRGKEFFKLDTSHTE